MGFEQNYDELVMTEKDLFQRICRVLLRQTFIVCDRNEESRKQYFFLRKHEELFSDYVRYMGFEVVVDRDNKVAMLRNHRQDVILVNRLKFRKFESIVLCCLWTIYVDQIREGNLSRPIMITVFDLRQAMERYGVKEEMEGKGQLKRALELFSRYQLIRIQGEIGAPDCMIRLFASLQFALDTEEFRKFAAEADRRMRQDWRAVQRSAAEPVEDGMEGGMTDDTEEEPEEEDDEP